MTATPESDFSQSRNAAEREFIARVNDELDYRGYSLAQRFEERIRPRSSFLLDDVPRVIHLTDHETYCPGKFASTTLRWRNKKTGECGKGAISLVAYLCDMTEFDAAQVIWRHTQSFEPSRRAGGAWMRGLRKMPSPAELRALQRPWTPIPCRKFISRRAAA